MAGTQTGTPPVAPEDLVRLGAARRRARTWAIVALAAAPALLAPVVVATARVDAPPRVRAAAGLGAVLAGAAALAVTQARWWSRSRRWCAATPEAAWPGTPRTSARTDLGRASALLGCAAAWCAVLFFAVVAAAAAAAGVPRPLGQAVWYLSWVLVIGTVIALIPLTIGWARAAAVLVYRSSQPGRQTPMRPASAPEDYARLAARLRSATGARRLAVRTMVVGAAMLLALSAGANGLPRLYGPGETTALAPAAGVFYLAFLAAFATTHVFWWRRARAAKALDDRLVPRTRAQHGWLRVRRVGAVWATAGTWLVLANPLGDVVRALLDAGRGTPALLLLYVGLPVSMVSAFAVLALSGLLLWGFGAATAAQLRTRTVAPRPRVAPGPPPAVELAELDRLRELARSARGVAVGVLLGSLAAQVAAASFLVPLDRFLPGADIVPRLLDTGPAVYVLSFLAWPLLIGSHYHWWRRSRMVLAARRRLLPGTRTGPGERLRGAGVGLLVAFGWFQIFYAGPYLAVWYRETGEREVADGLLGTYAPLPLYGAVIVLGFWVEPLIERGREALRQFAERDTAGAGRLSWRRVLPWVSRTAWAMLALTFLPLYLENWGLWDPPRPLFSAMLVAEAAVLVIALSAGWWRDHRRPREDDPSPRS